MDRDEKYIKGRKEGINGDGPRNFREVAIPQVSQRQ